MSINGFGNNLYATNMGATDAQIGLINFAPNIVAFILLIPAALAVNRMRSSRSLLTMLLSIAGLAYFAFALVPGMGQARMLMFFLLLSVVCGSIALYNAQWQTFFGESLPPARRSDVYTVRNGAMFAMAIVIPLLCGILMSGQTTAEGKLSVLQLFYVISGVLLLICCFTLMRLPHPVAGDRMRFSVQELVTSVRQVAGLRRFRLFILPFLLIYMLWHLDWSMWYIGQTQHVMMNEAELSVINGVFNIGQMAAIVVLARIARRRSPDFAIIISAFGLTLCPIMMVSTYFLNRIVSHTFAMIWFNVGLTILNAPQCGIAFCAMMILLDVTPTESRALIVSLYTMLITLSNSIIPYLGVQLYTALGAGERGFLLFNLIVWSTRTLAGLLMIWRYRVLKREGLLTRSAA